MKNKDIHDLIQYAAEHGENPVTLIQTYLYFRRGRWPSEWTAEREMAEVKALWAAPIRTDQYQEAK